MNKRKQIQRLIIATVGALLFTVLYLSDIMLTQANTVADAVYQQPKTPNSEIVLIGLDQYSVDEFGPMPWPRDLMADAIEYLNLDPEKRPAVIGIDTTYIGESENPEADAKLVEATGKYGNVVTASTATFGDELVINDDGTFYLDTFTIEAYEEPFDALKEVTTQGHINGMLDFDGVLRHGIWEIDLPDGRTIPSFHQSIYKMYMEYIGDEKVLKPTTDSRHMWYVNFQSAPGAFNDGFSIVDLVYQELDPEFFAGKIVLIGPYAHGMQDDYITAIDHSEKMYGVEYQANAIAALLSGELKAEVSKTPQAIIIFVFTFLAFFWYFDRGIRISTLVWVISTALSIGAYIYAFDRGYVFQIVYLPISLTVAYITSVATNYARAAFEKRKVTNTLHRYLAPEIANELLKGDPQALQLGGDLRDIAVLFVDIRGFTTMSEKLDARQVVEIVNKYLTLTSTCIFNNSGTLDKYVGDCTMAFWGAPLPQKDPIFLAVKAAIDMREGAKSLGEELMAEFGHSVDFGIGVHFGSAVVGNIGSPKRMDYTAIGDTVNTAARLESNAKPGQILVSRSVVEAIEDRIECKALGTLTLKGKSEPFEVFSIEKLL